MTATTNLDAAIATYSDDAHSLYNTVHTGAVQIPPIDPVTDDVKKAQTNLQSAFGQLTTAASMAAEQTDRAGLAAVVELMKTTAAKAEAISTMLVNHLAAHQTVVPPAVAPPALDTPFVNALTAALLALAQLSPSDVWTTR